MTSSPAKIHQVDFEDIEFGRAGDAPLIARLYRPRGITGFPGIVEVHGGAWTGGDRLNNVVIHNAVAAAGTAVLASEDVFLRVRDRFEFRALDAVVAKGMTRETRIFELVGASA